MKATGVSGFGGFFQVQGQYLYVRTTIYQDYVSDGSQNFVQQLVIDPQDTFPIFGTSGSETVGSELVHVQCHVLQPNVLVSFDPKPESLVASSSKVLLVLTSIPLQYPTGVGGTGFREFGWNKTTTQITPSNEPSWVNVFNFSHKQLPSGAVFDMSDQESNMLLGCIRVVDPDNFSQAEVTLQCRWSFTVKLPLPNLNVAKWAINPVSGSTAMDKIGPGKALGYSTALTEVTHMQKDHGGPSVAQALAATAIDEEIDELNEEFERINL